MYKNFSASCEVSNTLIGNPAFQALLVFTVTAFKTSPRRVLTNFEADFPGVKRWRHAMCAYAE